MMMITCPVPDVADEDDIEDYILVLEGDSAGDVVALVTQS